MDNDSVITGSNYQISYNPDLVQILRTEHQQLNLDLQWIEKLISENAIADTIKQLGELRSKILEHVSKEELMLYTYLQQSLKDSPESYSEMRLLRKKMNNDIVKVLAFLDAYITKDPDTVEITPFSEKFKTIKTLYIKRMLIEEKGLFPLYKEQ